jgi:REP element-mobilizing transposase RayT
MLSSQNLCKVRSVIIQHLSHRRQPRPPGLALKSTEPAPGPKPFSRDPRDYGHFTQSPRDLTSPLSPTLRAPHGPHRPIYRPRPSHHVTQRGNRRERVFFGEEDYELYRELLSSQCRKQGVAVWAYCLMPNHVHLILVDREEPLGRALGDTHRRYSSVINARASGDGPSLSVAFRLRGHGRGASDGGGPLCRFEPGPDAACR